MVWFTSNQGKDDTLKKRKIDPAAYRFYVLHMEYEIKKDLKIHTTF